MLEDVYWIEYIDFFSVTTNNFDLGKQSYTVYNKNQVHVSKSQAIFSSGLLAGLNSSYWGESWLSSSS